MIFLMMAAHDTTTSALTTMAYCLARHTDWQDRLRAEAQALPVAQLRFDDLAGAERTEWVMKEALRLYPPAPVVSRTAIEPCEIGGYQIPAGAEVVIEEWMIGEEASFFALCDGEHAIAFGGAQDHKRVGDGDTGPNTGGMGAYSPAPVLTDEIARQALDYYLLGKVPAGIAAIAAAKRSVTDLGSAPPARMRLACSTSAAGVRASGRRPSSLMPRVVSSGLVVERVA